MAKKIDLDEHSFIRKANNPSSLGWVSVVVDHSNKRLMEVVSGRTYADLCGPFLYIKEPENVREVTIDMSKTYKKFSYSFFLNARITIDKFHVIRLFSKEVNQARLELTGDKRNHAMKKFVLRSYDKLSIIEKIKLNGFMETAPVLKELYFMKEHMQRIYRTKSFKYVHISFNKLVNRLETSSNPVCQRLSRTLMKWRIEILNYFKSRLTNVWTEGFNNKEKLIKRRVYGYKSFKNYRLGLLNACA